MPAAPTHVTEMRQTAGELVASKISLNFDGFSALSEVDFVAKPGKVHAITGENGAGKSSLAKVLAGVYRPTSGTLSLNGNSLRLHSPKEGIKHGIALIHQEPMPLSDLTVAENLFCGHLPHLLPGIVNWKKVNEVSQKALSELGLNLNIHDKAEGLSIADQQLLELGAAMVQGARTWFFDETTAPLTPKETARLFEVIQQLKESGCAIVIVSHHLHEIFEISDEITVLRDGKKVAHLTTSETSIPEVVRLMVGRDLNTSHSQSRTIPDSVACEITDLSGEGFQNVSFSIHHGEIFGLAGLVGAGRTEVTRAIFGIMPFDKGTVKLNEKTIKCSSPIEAIQMGIALVPEDRRGDGLFLSRPILENTTLVHLKQFASKMGILRRTQERSRVLEILSKMRTAMRNEQLAVGKLSGGNQQKVMLAKWLISAPKLLMLDEPTRGVDIGAKADVHQLIRDVADQGTPILVVSSDLPEILTLCDRIGVMNKGRLVQILSQQEATQEKIMELATQ